MQTMQNLTQVQFTDSSRNSDLETGGPLFRGAFVATPEGTVRPSRIDTASGSTRYRRTETPILAEVMGYVHTNPEDAIIDGLDNDHECEDMVWDEEGDLVEVWREEEPFVRPEPYVRRAHDGVVRRIGRDRDGNRTVDVTKYVCYWPGAKATKEPAAEVKASNPAPSEPVVEAEPVNARPVARPIVRDVIGASRTPRRQFRGAQGRTRPQPKATPRRVARPQPKAQAKPGERRMCANEKCHTEFLPPQHAPNASLCRSCHQKEMRKLPTRTCKCGKTFHPPVVAPDATLCRDCHKKEREAAKKRWEAKRPHIEAMQTMRDAQTAQRIRQAVLNGKPLPAGVILKKDDGCKVTVEFHGKPLEVVYRMRSGKTERKRQARRSRYVYAA